MDGATHGLSVGHRWPGGCGGGASVGRDGRGARWMERGVRSAWETYYKELLSTGNGHALWEADPGSDSAVDIANVGYMEEGGIVRLFNASKEIGDVSNKFGIPNGYKPLHVAALREGMLSASLPITSKTVLQHKVRGNLSGG